jgi:hypothetical protein
MTLVSSVSQYSGPRQRHVTVIGRNPDGSPVAGGQTVILTASLGT